MYHSDLTESWKPHFHKDLYKICQGTVWFTETYDKITSYEHVFWTKGLIRPTLSIYINHIYLSSQRRCILPDLPLPIARSQLLADPRTFLIQVVI